jgi:hypothetical protein
LLLIAHAKMQGNWLGLVNKNANASVDKFRAIFLII